MSQKVGFVGVGRMGANMARRLKDCGYEVSAVYDIRSETASELAEELGTTACSTLAQVTELSEVIITVVIDDASMKSIFAAKGDSLLTGAEGRIFINCATISPSVHIEVEGLAKAAGAESLEGCMASSITQARDGTLYLMLGGEKTTYDKVEELLGKLSVNKRYVGTSGKAAQVKALVNMVMNINTAGLAEGLGLADSLGLDINTVSGFTLLSLASFAGAFALGSSSRFGALTVIMASIYGLEYLPWFFAVDFVGYLISPMHKCVAIGMLYFGTKLRYYATILGIWGGLVIATAGLTLL